MLHLRFERGLHEWNNDVGLCRCISGRKGHELLALCQEGVIKLSFGEQKIVLQRLQMRQQFRFNNDQMPEMRCHFCTDALDCPIEGHSIELGLRL